MLPPFFAIASLIFLFSFVRHDITPLLSLLMMAPLVFFTLYAAATDFLFFQR